MQPKTAAFQSLNRQWSRIWSRKLHSERFSGPSSLSSNHSPRTRNFSSHTPGVLATACNHPPLQPVKARSFSRFNALSKGRATTQEVASDPFNFEELKQSTAGVVQKLKDDLSKLRPGGQIAIEDVESIKVQIAIPGPGNTGKVKQSVPLGDLAQAIPKGKRIMTFLVSEKEQIKAIQSAIMSSDLSLAQSLHPSSNPLELNYTLPPPTTEARNAVLNNASAAGEKATTKLRDARAAQQKKLRALEKERKVRADDLHKARAQMEALVRGRDGEIKQLVDDAKKRLQSS